MVVEVHESSVKLLRLVVHYDALWIKVSQSNVERVVAVGERREDRLEDLLYLVLAENHLHHDKVGQVTLGVVLGDYVNPVSLVLHVQVELLFSIT